MDKECKKIELCPIYKPGSNLWVRITHVNNPHSFYVRPTKYNKFIVDLETEYIPTEKLDEVYMHQWIVFKLDSLSTTQYIRGQILNIDDKENETTCDIFAIDYGYLHKSIPLKNIWKCEDSLVNIPPLAVQCFLANCSPIGGSDWSDAAIDAIKYYFGDEKAKMIVINQLTDKLVVEIINTCPDDIATLLALTGFSTLGYNYYMNSRLAAIPAKKKFYNFRTLTISETLHVRMQHGSSLEEFYVTEVNDYLKYINNQEIITLKTKKEKLVLNEELVQGLPVCILDEFRKGERCIVKSILPSKSEAIVRLVDTGKEITAHTVNMRQVPEECLANTVCALFCSATQHQLFDNTLIRFLHPGHEFLITVVEVGYNFDSPNIVSITRLDKK